MPNDGSLALSPDPALVTAPSAASENARLLAELADWAHTHFGMSFGADRKSLLAARVGQLVIDRKTTLAALVDTLKRGDKSMNVALAEALSTNHTYFFREPEVLDYFKSRVLPDLRARNEARIWSAACSCGDEPYSLAMMAIDAWGAAEARKKLSILGTDISQRMVADAEAGLYGGRHVAGLHPDLLRGHFRSAGLGQLMVSADVKALCQFRRLNLTALPWPFQKGFHVIFLRNVLYYFDAERQRQVLEACFDHALPGAYLFTSLTEPLHEIVTRWRQVEPAVFRKAG